MLFPEGQQAEFVAWWRENVRGKGKRSNGPDLGYFVDDAETQTGIRHQQVSKWAARLKNPDAYRLAGGLGSSFAHNVVDTRRGRTRTAAAAVEARHGGKVGISFLHLNLQLLRAGRAAPGGREQTLGGVRVVPRRPIGSARTPDGQGGGNN